MRCPFGPAFHYVCLWPCNLLLCRFNHVFRHCKTEPLEQVLERSRRTETAHADPGTCLADVTIPADHRTHLDGDPGGNVGRENAIAVRLVLLLKQLPRGHADDARRNALFLELLVSLDAQGDFAARAYQDDVWLAVFGIGEHVSASAYARGWCIAGTVEGRHRLAAQRQTRRPVLEPDHYAPRFRPPHWRPQAAV